MNQLIRRVTLRPYREGANFTLSLYATDGRDWRGQSRLGYRLHIRENGQTRCLFEGGNFFPSPLHADDSDAALLGLLEFLTLRPGDTDEEYFDAYTAEQLEYCSLHAEFLNYAAHCRFDPEFGAR